MRNLYRVVMAALLAATSGCAGTSINSAVVQAPQGDGYFPSVTVADLEGLERRLPGELPTQYSVIILGFAHEQRGEMDAWARAASERTHGSPEISIVRVPVIDSSIFPLRAVIRAGMRSKIDGEARKRAMPLFTDKAAFLEAIGGDGSQPEVLLVERSGRISWRGRGAPDDGSLKELESSLANIIEQGK